MRKKKITFATATLVLLLAAGPKASAASQRSPSPEASAWSVGVSVYAGNPADRKIAPGAAVALAGRTLPVWTLETNTDGEVVFHGIPAGTYTLGVSAPGCVPLVAPVQVPMMLTIKAALECSPTQVQRQADSNAQTPRKLAGQPRAMLPSKDAAFVAAKRNATATRRDAPIPSQARLAPSLSRLPHAAAYQGFRYVTANRVETLGPIGPDSREERMHSPALLVNGAAANAALGGGPP